MRSRTLAHAKASGGVQHQAPKRPVHTLITEMDGTMLPMVTTKTGPGLDGRKAKQLFWREARLCLARPLDAVDAVYGATFGTAQVAALLWREVGETAGLGPQSRVHGLGDGATWIVNNFQEELLSGADSQATYTVDFHHVSDYLAAAAKVVAPERNKDWLHQQQGWLRQNCVSEVLRALAPHLEPEQPGQEEEEKGPVRSAHGYISERKQYLNYAGALAEGLPIGSGEVEEGGTDTSCKSV